MARSYAFDRIVASVAITPMIGMGFAPAAFTAALAPGSTTPVIDSAGANSARIAGSASAVAVLQAITTCLGFCGRRKLMICRTNDVTVADDFDPYGSRAVSPK